MKRYWAFKSAEYECKDGMMDFNGDFDNYGDAKIKALEPLSPGYTDHEWGAVFDSHTGEQTNYRYGKTVLSPIIIPGWGKDPQPMLSDETRSIFNCSEDYFEQVPLFNSYKNIVVCIIFTCKICGWSFRNSYISEAGLRPEVLDKMRDHVYLKHK